MGVRVFISILAVVAALGCASASSQEIIVWYDEQGVAHKAGSPEEIPQAHRAQAQGVLTTLDPAMAAMAADEGSAIGLDQALYRDGLGLFQHIRFEMDMEQVTGHVFLGTKYNLVKARAAALKGGQVPASYIASVNALGRLPVAFYSWSFKPVLMLLIQDGRIIKGEEGFGKDTDPGFGIPAHVKTFPYEALDFAKPVQVQLYSREGNLVQLTIELPAYR